VAGFLHVQRPVAASSDRDIVTSTQKISCGGDLKIGGQNLILVGVIVAILVVIGVWQNAEKTPVVEVPKATPQSASELEMVTPPSRKGQNDAINLRKVTPKSPRKFVAPHVTPTFLAGLDEGERSIYLGKWILVSGPIGKIDLISDRYAQVQFIRLIKPTPEKPFIYMVFNNEWIDGLVAIPKKQNILVLGQISILLTNGMTLTNCEIIEDTKADVQ
jgi:hypothetical protein